MTTRRAGMPGCVLTRDRLTGGAPEPYAESGSGALRHTLAACGEVDLHLLALDGPSAELGRGLARVDDSTLLAHQPADQPSHAISYRPAPFETPARPKSSGDLQIDKGFVRGVAGIGYGWRCSAPVFQSAENAVSNTVQCGFESHPCYLNAFRPVV